MAKTAAYTIKPPMDRDGTLFTNRGATGAVTFTLPAPSEALRGYVYHFEVVADQTVTVAGTTILTSNNAAAASLSAQTGGQKIGAIIEAICDGTQWAVVGIAAGHTFTVA